MLDNLRAALHRRASHEDGATAVEYALMVAAIAALIIVVVFALGNTVSDTLCDTETAISTQGATTNC